MSKVAAQPKKGRLILEGWQGTLTQEVLVVGETPKRYRIRAITKTRLAGKRRFLFPDETVLVPKHAIVF